MLAPYLRPNPRTPLGVKKRKPYFLWLLLPFGSVFVYFGLMAIFSLTVPTLVEWVDAQSWIETPCTILHSEVEVRPSSDSKSYLVSISYRYEYNGQGYTGRRFQMGNFSSGRKGKEAIVARYPEGAQRVCYVNPKNPAASVLDRRFSFMYLLGAIAGIVFIPIGCFVAYVPIFAFFHSKRTGSEKFAVAPDPRPLKLKPRDTPGSRLFRASFFILLWNGLFWMPVFFGPDDATNRFAWWHYLMFFLVLVVIGIYLVNRVFKEMLMLRNPSPVLSLTPGGLQLGREARIHWHFTGATDRIAKLRIWLEGCERSTYFLNKKRVTDESVFEKLLIVESDNPQDMSNGRVHFAMPAFTMHSFKSDHNEVHWRIMVHGDIEGWPDIDFHFPVQVYPLPPKG